MLQKAYENDSLKHTAVFEVLQLFLQWQKIDKRRWCVNIAVSTRTEDFNAVAK